MVHTIWNEKNIIKREQQIYKNSDSVTGSTGRKLSPPQGSEVYIK